MKRSIVALSGWGFPASVFEPLKAHCPMEVVALPGLKEWPGIFTQEDISWPNLITALDRMLPEEPVILAGWSLGGSLAIRYTAANPHRVAALTVLGCNPCFVARESWPDAMEEKLFKRFLKNIHLDNETTFKKFLFLCCQGADNMRGLLQEMQAISDNQVQNWHILAALLAFLQDDLRSELHRVSCPVTHIFSQQDALVPVSAATLIQQNYPSHRVVTNLKGGHLFFRDQPDYVSRQIMPVAESIRDNRCVS